MVFAPNRDVPIESHEPAATPRRRDRVKPPPPAPPRARLPWRAVVHTSGQNSVHTAWHMAGCRGEHCAEGRQLLETLGDPDGHCLIDGTCSRCEPPAADQR